MTTPSVHSFLTTRLLEVRTGGFRGEEIRAVFQEHLTDLEAGRITEDEALRRVNNGLRAVYLNALRLSEMLA